MDEQKLNSGNPVTSEAPVNTGTGTKTAVPAKKENSNLPWIAAGCVILLIGLIVLFIKLGPETTGHIRDVTLIIFALETVVTATALVVLVVQLARLVNFLKFEVEPILNNTNKTVKKFSGTVSFLCDNAVEPTVNAASTLAGIKNAASGILSLFKKN